MLDAGVSLRDVQIAARHADQRTTMRYTGRATTSTGTRTTSSPRTWPQERDQPRTLIDDVGSFRFFILAGEQRSARYGSAGGRTDWK